MKLIFVPGAACGRKVWLCQSREFPDSEAVSLPGHPEGEPCPSVADYAAWLRDYLRERRYQDVVLAGHSMGGAVAQRHAIDYGDEIKAVILIGTGARLRIRPDLLDYVRDMADGKLEWRDYLEERHRTTVPEVRQEIIDERMQIGPAVMLNDLLACDKFDVMDKIRAIRLPTLVIAGREDELAPVKYADYLANQIKGARKLIVPGAAHWVITEKPREVNRAIADFLAGL
ncbi:MAG: alpha/beta hydrolase [Dehalococcoidales bacterium]|nr:alpha/beta hydrolase [Dehalococcoidales bacterium]